MTIHDHLIANDEASYGADYRAHCLEMYKLYVQMADNISNRRQSANSFFLSINTAIFAVFGLSENAFTEWSWGLSLAGIVLCYSWCRLIRSYKDLNTAKFKVVHEMEKELPFTPFDAEWEAVGRGENSELYLPFTEAEMKIPWVFAAMHVGAFLVATVPFLIEQFCKVSP